MLCSISALTALMMKKRDKTKTRGVYELLLIVALASILPACEQRGSEENKNVIALVGTPFEVTGPETSYNDSILVTGHRSDGMVEQTWSIKIFPSETLVTKERKWRFSLQSKKKYTENWMQRLGNLDEHRKWGMSDRIAMPAEYLDTVHKAFENFIISCDNAQGKDLGDGRIPMVNIDNLKIYFVPGGVSGHRLYVEYYDALYVFYGYEDVKAYLELLEKRPEILRMRRDINNNERQRGLDVKSNIEEIFGGRRDISEASRHRQSLVVNSVRSFLAHSVPKRTVGHSNV